MIFLRFYAVFKTYILQMKNVQKHTTNVQSRKKCVLLIYYPHIPKTCFTNNLDFDQVLCSLHTNIASNLHDSIEHGTTST